MATFEEKFQAIWVPYVNSTKDPKLSQAELNQLGKDCDEAISALQAEYSHPDALPDRHR